MVDDLLVLENISLQRGTVVIDATTSDLLTDDLKDTSGEDLIRILPDGYLSVLSNSSEHSRVRYEPRDYDDTVRHTIETTEEIARGNTINFLPLDNSIIKVRMADEDEEQDIAVLDWDTDTDHRIPLDIEVDTTDIFNLSRVDSSVGPMTFREVPGAVLLREYPQNDIPRLTALR